MGVAGVRVRRRRAGVPGIPRRPILPALTAGAPAALPWALAAVLLALIFAAGGFFPDVVARAAIAAGAALVVWVALARRPWAALGIPLGVAIGALALLALWAVASGGWSGARGRALLEGDRTLLYALAVALTGLAAASAAVRRAAPPAVAIALALACVAGLVARLLPDVWPTPAGVDFERLSFPLTYWNAMGLAAALALIAALHVAADAGRGRVTRALAAAAMPVCATTLLLTLSRGAIVVAPLGLAAYLLLARPRAAASALVATVPACAIAVLAAYRAEAVVSAQSAAAMPAADGRALLAVVAACALGAGVAIMLLGPLDRRVHGRRRRPPASRGRRIAIAGAAAAALLVAALAAGAPDRIAAQADRLSGATYEQQDGDVRGRLTSLADNGRVEQWDVALDAFAAAPVRGTGAGTFAVLWTEGRSTRQEVTDGHSLYLEVLAETGLVGAALLLAALGALAAGALLRLRGEERALGALALALLLAWAVHAGIDWDWELPGVTLPVLALAAVAAASVRPRRGPGRPRTDVAVRAAVCAAIVLALLAPLAVLRSQAPLEQAIAALRAGDCATAGAEARRSAAVLSWRAEPLQVLALCEAQAGDGAAAIASMRAALERDPRNWRLLHGLAVVRALAGQDPRPALEEARRRNPNSRLAAEALRRFDGAPAARWPAIAATVPVPL